MTISLKYSIIIPMIMDWEKRRIIEHQKAKYREKIAFHTQNAILQSIITFMCVTGGFYAGIKKSIMVPLVAYPMAAVSVSKLAKHETKRRRFKKILEGLERS